MYALPDLSCMTPAADVVRYKGGSLFEVLDNTDPLPRDPLGPFRMSVIDKYKDMGTIAMGKSEAGIVRKGDRLYVMPNKCVTNTGSPASRTCCQIRGRRASQLQEL